MADLYFQGFDSAFGTELWKTTSNGVTTRVTDIAPGAANSGARPLGVYNDELYFTAFTAANSSQLWKIQADGTQVLVFDFSANPPLPIVGNGTPIPMNAVIFDGELHFQVQQRDQSSGIIKSTHWQIDSTGALTQTPIPLFGLFFYPSAYVEHNGKLYFAGQNGGVTNGEPGVELWSLDAADNFVQVANINVGSGLFSSNPGNFQAFNGELYFAATGSGTSPTPPFGVERELFKVDTTGNVVLVANINTQLINSLNEGSSNPANLTVFNNALYFTAASQSITNNFFAQDTEVWRLDAGAAAPVRVADINPGIGSSNPRNFMVFNGELYFSARSDASNEELWKIDTTGNAVQVDIDPDTAGIQEILPGTTGSAPQLFTIFNNALYFAATDAVAGQEIWKVSSTGAVSRVADINPGINPSVPVLGIFSEVLNNELYFSARFGTNTFLYKVDANDVVSIATNAVNAVPSLAIAATDATKSEGDAGTTAFTFTVSLSGLTSTSQVPMFPVDLTVFEAATPTPGTTVTYTVTGLGANPADAGDFVGGFQTGLVTFAAGETSKVITINVAGDALVEADETFRVTLSGATGGVAIGTPTATGTIQNDDAAALPLVSVALAPATVDEGGGFTLTATRSGADLSQPTTLTYTITGDAANSGDISTPLTGTITILANQTSATLAITTVEDTVVEADETFTVTASAPVNATIGTGTATATITNDDAPPPPPVVSVALAPATVDEGGGFTLTATRSGADLSQPTTLTYTITGDAANSGDISTPLTGTITILANQTSATLAIATMEDTVVEADETFTVTASAPVNATIGTGTATATITNDDAPPPPVLAIAPTDATKAEGNAGTTAFSFSVTRSGDTTGASSATYAVTGTANAADFGGTLPTGSVTFAAGETAQVITINVSGDITVEADETFSVTLAGPTGASIGTAAATGTITNDDTGSAPPIVGTNGCDYLRGTSGADVFIPKGGDDTVHAGAGNDKILATIKDGDDCYDGGSGSDTVDYSALTAGVNVNLSSSHGWGSASGLQSGYDSLYSIENVIGSRAGDVIRGNSAANRLEGGGGNDILSGGSNSDTFVFSDAAFGRDRITDFDRNGDDVIECSTSVFADFAAVQAAMSVSGGNVVITLDAYNSITLERTALASVTSDDFRLI